MAVQHTTNTYPSDGLPGELARPHEPYAIDLLPIHVPANGRKPRPGDKVYWDTTANGVATVTNDAQNILAFGIVTYEQGKVGDTLSTRPTNADTPTFVEYEDDDYAPIGVMGTFYVTAGGAVEYGNRLDQQTDFKWDNEALANDEHYKASFTCVSLSGADNSLIECRVNPQY